MYLSGRIVLDELGLDVEVYFASEVDPDALMLCSVRHGENITQIGDVTLLNTDKVRQYNTNKNELLYIIAPH